MKLYYFTIIIILSTSCVARNYTHYLIEPAPKKNPVLKEDKGTLMRPFGFGSNTVMKVRWNDGKIVTEVQIPMLASGQLIIVEHTESSGDIKTIPATRLVPPPPSIGDKSLIDAYRERGLKVNQNAPDVSITRSKSLMQEALKSGNYQLALEWCELVLAKFPSHPEFLKAKASVLLLMGEKDKAIEIYETVEEIESDPLVRKKLEELQNRKK